MMSLFWWFFLFRFCLQVRSEFRLYELGTFSSFVEFFPQWVEDGIRPSTIFSYMIFCLLTLLDVPR